MFEQSIFMVSINTTNRVPRHILFPFFQGQNMTVLTIHISKYKNISVRLLFLLHWFLPTYGQRHTTKWCYSVFHMEKYMNTPTTSREMPWIHGVLNYVSCRYVRRTTQCWSEMWHSASKKTER